MTSTMIAGDVQVSETFVTRNVENVFTGSRTTFEEHVKDYDSTDDSFYPVVLYMKNGEAVAWYDEEMANGYAPQD